jgi:hypothetical protein
MNRPCRFSDTNLKFEGTPIEQARCLLRTVRVLGNVNDEPATLPAFLEEIIGQPVAFTRDQLANLARASLHREEKYRWLPVRSRESNFGWKTRGLLFTTLAINCLETASPQISIPRHGAPMI